MAVSWTDFFQGLIMFFAILIVPLLGIYSLGGINGAVGGIIAGGATVLCWEHLHGGLFDIYEIIPGFIFSVIVIIAVSLIDKKPSQKILDEFDSVGVDTGRNFAMT